MWILYAFGSAFFAGITSILAKLGISKTDSTLATAIRTIVVVIFAWLMVWLTGSFGQLYSISNKTFLFLILSGLSTGASWLCYFRALQKGPASQVVAVDKSSTVITIVLSFILLHETVSSYSVIGTILIAAGTFLMLDPNPFAAKQKSRNFDSSSWLFAAAGSALFASLSAIFGKIGIDQIDSNLGTAIRTMVVLVMAWLMVFIQKKQKWISQIPKKELGFILASGLATGASWLCFFKALHMGPASAVVPIDKLSILVTILFSVLVLHEKLSAKSWTGLLILIAGTLLMLL